MMAFYEGKSRKWARRRRHKYGMNRREYRAFMEEYGKHIKLGEYGMRSTVSMRNINIGAGDD